MENRMDETEIKGSVSVTEDGRCIVDVHTNGESLRMYVTPSPDSFLLEFDTPRMTSGITVSDIIEARVEIASVLREAYGFDEWLIDLCKHCIDDAWCEPYDVYMAVESMVADAKEWL